MSVRPYVPNPINHDHMALQASPSPPARICPPPPPTTPATGIKDAQPPPSLGNIHYPTQIPSPPTQPTQQVATQPAQVSPPLRLVNTSEQQKFPVPYTQQQPVMSPYSVEYQQQYYQAPPQPQSYAHQQSPPTHQQVQYESVSVSPGSSQNALDSSYVMVSPNVLPNSRSTHLNTDSTQTVCCKLVF